MAPCWAAWPPSMAPPAARPASLSTRSVRISSFSVAFPAPVSVVTPRSRRSSGWPAACSSVSRACWVLRLSVPPPSKGWPIRPGRVVSSNASLTSLIRLAPSPPARLCARAPPLSRAFLETYAVYSPAPAGAFLRVCSRRPSGSGCCAAAGWGRPGPTGRTAWGSSARLGAGSAAVWVAAPGIPAGPARCCSRPRGPPGRPAPAMPSSSSAGSGKMERTPWPLKMGPPEHSETAIAWR